MVEDKIWLKNKEEIKNHFIKYTEQNELMNNKYKKDLRIMN